MRVSGPLLVFRVLHLTANTLLFGLVILWPASPLLAAEDAPESAAVEAAPEQHQQHSEGAPNPQKPPTKEGDSIWLEKKITPTTRWLEKMVKPLSTWMEQQIQSPRNNLDSQQKNHWVGPEGVSTTAPDVSEDAIISARQAAASARRLIDGEVLKVKLLSLNQVPSYRVKLISTAGEIHIVYINAHSGALIQPTQGSDHRKE